MVRTRTSASREHHFVPQFYLRRFSSDGKRINLFNIGGQRVIVGASIKHQCSRHNFYGFASRVEEAFSELEGSTAAIIRKILSTKELPPHTSAEWLLLLSYIVFQKLRTTNAAYQNDAMTDYLAKILLRDDPKCRGLDMNSVLIQNVYAVALPLSLAKEIIPIASDLRGHLVVNQTTQEFMTSDDPVVIHNQYCEGINYSGVNGWACRGLQVFWPISPELLLLLYDPVVYKVGMAHRGKPSSGITSEADITQLNSLQNLERFSKHLFRNCGEQRGY